MNPIRTLARAVALATLASAASFTVQAAGIPIGSEALESHVTTQVTAIDLATRQAERLQAQSKLTQQASLIAASDAQVASSQASLGRSQIDLNRAETLRKPGYVSEERVTTLSADNHIARSSQLCGQAER